MTLTFVIDEKFIKGGINPKMLFIDGLCEDNSKSFNLIN